MLAWMDVIAAVGEGLDFTPNGETKGPFGVSKKNGIRCRKNQRYITVEKERPLDSRNI